MPIKGRDSAGLCARTGITHGNCKETSRKSKNAQILSLLHLYLYVSKAFNSQVVAGSQGHGGNINCRLCVQPLDAVLKSLPSKYD